MKLNVGMKVKIIKVDHPYFGYPMQLKEISSTKVCTLTIGDDVIHVKAEFVEPWFSQDPMAKRGEKWLLKKGGIVVEILYRPEDEYYRVRGNGEVFTIHESELLECQAEHPETPEETDDASFLSAFADALSVRNKWPESIGRIREIAHRLGSPHN